MALCDFRGHCFETRVMFKDSILSPPISSSSVGVRRRTAPVFYAWWIKKSFNKWKRRKNSFGERHDPPSSRPHNFSTTMNETEWNMLYYIMIQNHLVIPSKPLKIFSFNACTETSATFVVTILLKELPFKHWTFSEHVSYEWKKVRGRHLPHHIMMCKI